MDKTIGYIITAGHLDIEWYQPLRSYRFWTMEALDILQEAAKRDDFRTYVLDGQIYPLEEVLEVSPEKEPVFRELIAEGKLTVGPFYTQFDEWIPSAENMIRNCLYGKRKSEAYGGYMRAGYLPDNFGHPLQLPQILNNFGIDSLMFTRGMPEIPGGHPDEFLYRGIDGSEVLASHFRESYFGAFDIFDKNIEPLTPREVPYYDLYLSYEYHRELADHDDPQRIAENLVKNVREIRERYPSGVVPLIAGYDHLPPQINIGDSVRCANEMQDEIEFIMGDASGYADLVRSRWKDPKVYQMELIGSKYQHILLGALSTRSYLKRENFSCEALLEKYTEPLLAFAHLQGYQGGKHILDEAWKFMMMNSAHDSIHGSSTDETHMEMQARYAAVRQDCAGLIHEAFAYLGRGIPRWWKDEKVSSRYRPAVADYAHRGGDRDYPVTNRGLLSFSPVQTNHIQTAWVWLPIGDDAVSIRARDGREFLAQPLDRENEIPKKNGRGEIRNSMFPYPLHRRTMISGVFRSGRIESLAAFPGQPEDGEVLLAGDTWLENEYLRVETENGLLHILDKQTGRCYDNQNLLVEEADAGDAWDYSPSWIQGKIVHSTDGSFTSRRKEAGPVMAVLAIDGEMKVPVEMDGDLRSKEETSIPLHYEISLYRGIRRVDVQLKLDNRAKDHRIRLKITPGTVTSSVLSQGHLAVIERSIDRQIEIEAWKQPSSQLVPFREWIASEDGKEGLACGVRGAYEYEAVRNPLTREVELYVTLLRSIGMMGRLNTMQRKGPASESIDTPQAQCLFEQVFEWSFFPYQVEEGNRVPFLEDVQSYLYPPVLHLIRSEEKEGNIENNEQTLFGWEEKNIQLSSFKQRMDDEGYVLRFYENQGRETEMLLQVWEKFAVCRSNMNEDRLETLQPMEGRLKLRIRPYEAVTLLLQETGN